MRRGALALAAAVLLVAACTPASNGPDAGTSTRTPPSSAGPTSNHGPESLPALFDEEVTGGDLRRLSTIRDFEAYTSYRITYRSGDLTISGVMNVPAGDGPFPAVVLNHGYVPPKAYVNGQGMERERHYLAR